MSKLEELESKIVQWHKDRNLIEGATNESQFKKLMEEADELKQSIMEGNSPVDDIGDMIVVLINIATRNNLTLEECLAHAYNDIKDRKGRMIDGMFVKEKDLFFNGISYERV